MREVSQTGDDSIFASQSEALVSRVEYHVGGPRLAGAIAGCIENERSHRATRAIFGDTKRSI